MKCGGDNKIDCSKQVPVGQFHSSEYAASTHRSALDVNEDGFITVENGGANSPDKFYEVQYALWPSPVSDREIEDPAGDSLLQDTIIMVQGACESEQEKGEMLKKVGAGGVKINAGLFKDYFKERGIRGVDQNNDGYIDLKNDKIEEKTGGQHVKVENPVFYSRYSNIFTDTAWQVGAASMFPWDKDGNVKKDAGKP